MDDLKTCPFCGKRPAMHGWPGHGYFIAKCGTENCYGNPTSGHTFDTEIEAVDAWNGRRDAGVGVRAPHDFSASSTGGVESE